MKLGDIVRQYREYHDLSMDEFAKKCSLSKGYISMLEKNQNPKSKKPIVPSLETIKNIANALGKDFNDLIQLLDENQNVSLIPSVAITEIGKLSTNQSSIDSVNSSLNFLEKLDCLMNKNNMNKSTLSKACNIPYTTIDGWYKKGYDGLKLTTLRKLADFFDTTLDFWVNDNKTTQLSNSTPTVDSKCTIEEKMTAILDDLRPESGITYYNEGKVMSDSDKELLRSTLENMMRFVDQAVKSGK